MSTADGIDGCAVQRKARRRRNWLPALRASRFVYIPDLPRIPVSRGIYQAGLPVEAAAVGAPVQCRLTGILTWPRTRAVDYSEACFAREDLLLVVAHGELRSEHRYCIDETASKHASRWIDEDGMRQERPEGLARPVPHWRGRAVQHFNSRIGKGEISQGLCWPRHLCRTPRPPLQRNGP